MTRPIFILPVVCLAAACTTHLAQRSWPTDYVYLSTSANEVIGKAVVSMKGLTATDRVVLIDLAPAAGEDEWVSAVVQDAFVQGLAESGLTVVERDNDGLRVLVQEGSGETVPYMVTGRAAGPNEPLILEAQVITGGGPTRYLVNGSATVFVPPDTALLDVGPVGGDDKTLSAREPTLRHAVVAATKAVEYRLIDVGVRSTPEGTNVRRFAHVVLHTRVVDTRYGTVLWSGWVEGTVEDTVPAGMAAELQSAMPAAAAHAGRATSATPILPTPPAGALPGVGKRKK